MELIRLKDGSAEYISNDKDVADIVEKYCGNDLAEIIREWNHDKVAEELESCEVMLYDMETEKEILEDELINYAGLEEAICEIKEIIGKLRMFEEDGEVIIPDLVNEYLDGIIDVIN